MPPSEPHWEELTWSWAWSTGHRTSDQRLEPAAKAAWPYALLCAWAYLNDRDSAHDLMDHAVQNAADYLDRHPESPDWKLIARIKSMLRRRAKQLAHKHRLEIPYGSFFDLEHLLTEQMALCAVDILKIGLIGYSFNPLLKWDHFIVAGHNADRAKL